MMEHNRKRKLDQCSKLMDLPNELWMKIIKLLNLPEILVIKEFKPQIFNLVNDITGVCNNQFHSETTLIEIFKPSEFLGGYDKHQINKFIELYSNRDYYFIIKSVSNPLGLNQKQITSNFNEDIGSSADFLSGYPIFYNLNRISTADTPTFDYPIDSIDDKDNNNKSVLELREFLSTLVDIYKECPFISMNFCYMGSFYYPFGHNFGHFDNHKNNNDLIQNKYNDQTSLIYFNQLKNLDIYIPQGLNCHNFIKLINPSLLTQLSLTIYPRILNDLNFPNLENLTINIFDVSVGCTHVSNDKYGVIIKNVNVPNLKYLKISYMCSSDSYFETVNFNFNSLDLLAITDKFKIFDNPLSQKPFEENLFKNLLKDPSKIKQISYFGRTIPKYLISYENFKELKHIFLTQDAPPRLFNSVGEYLSNRKGNIIKNAELIPNFNNLKSFGLRVLKHTTRPFDYFNAPNCEVLYLSFNNSTTVITDFISYFLKPIPNCLPNLKEIHFTGSIYSNEFINIENTKVNLPNVETVVIGDKYISKNDLFNVSDFLNCVIFEKAKKLIIYLPFDNDEYLEGIKVYDFAIDVKINAINLEEIIFKISDNHKKFLLEHKNSGKTYTTKIHQEGINNLQRIAFEDFEMIDLHLDLIGFNDFQYGMVFKGISGFKTAERLSVQRYESLSLPVKEQITDRIRSLKTNDNE